MGARPNRRIFPVSLSDLAAYEHLLKRCIQSANRWRRIDRGRPGAVTARQLKAQYEHDLRIFKAKMWLRKVDGKPMRW